MPFFSTTSLKSFTRRRGVASPCIVAGTTSRIAVVALELAGFHGFHCDELDCGGCHCEELEAGTALEELEPSGSELDEDCAVAFFLATPAAAKSGAKPAFIASRAPAK